MHATPILSSRRPPASQQVRAVHFSNTRGGFAAGVWRLSPLRTPIVVNKKTCRASMICVTILRSFLLLFCKSASPKMQDNRASPSRSGRMPHDDAETVSTYGIWTSFGRDSRGETSSWAQQPAGAYYFMIRRHTHCLSPGIALTLLIISDAAGNIGWIQPFGIGSVGLKGWERICRIFAISCLLCDCMSALETTGQN
jgi:hypothetical protein